MAINSLGSSLSEKIKDGVNWMAKPYRIALLALLLAAPLAKGQNVGINTTGAAPDGNALLDVAGGNTYVDALRIRGLLSGPDGAFLKTDINGDVSRTNFSGLATQYLDGTGNFSTPPGASKWTLSGTMLYPNNITDNVNIGKLVPTNINKVTIVGNMSIGDDGYTNAPAPLFGLQAQGPIRTGTNVGTAQLDGQILASNATTNLFNLQKGGTNYFRVRNDGFIGAGTVNPGQRFTLHSSTIGNVNIRQQYSATDNYADIKYSPSGYEREVDIKTLGPQPAKTHFNINGGEWRMSYGPDADLLNTTISSDRAGHYFLTTIPEDIGMVVNFDTGIASSTTPKPAFQVSANTADGPNAVAAHLRNGDLHITTTNPIEGRIYINGIVQPKTIGDGPILPPVAGLVRGDEFLLTPVLQWYKFNGVAWALDN